MPSLTIRDIPADVLARIRALAERERRSMNKQFLVIVEDGIAAHVAAGDNMGTHRIPAALQLAVWQDLAGKWKDARTPPETIAEIRRARTGGREVKL